MTATVARILAIPASRARLVIGYLRCEHRALDGLSAAQIRKAYAQISPCIDADPDLADRVACSYGL